VSFATAKSDILQSSSSGAFANNAANAPKAAIVFIVNGFIMLMNVIDQGAIFDSADRPHGWWAARTSGTWTPSVANEAYTGELTSTPGKITAGRAFGQVAIAYKERSMYQGVYIGVNGWDFTQIPGDAGALTHAAVIDVGTEKNPIHLSMGYDDFYIYDGSRPFPIGNPVKRTVFGELNRSAVHLCMTLHNRTEKTVYFYYPVNSSTVADKCVVYNYQRDKWGRDDRSVEAVVEWVQPGVTYDDLGTLYATYEDFPSSSYDTAFLSAGFPSPGIFNTSHVFQTLDGPSSSSAMTTGDVGSDAFVSLLSRVQPQFLTKPTSATMTNYYRENIGDSLTADTTIDMDSKGRFDVLRSSNWHRSAFAFTGEVEMPEINAELQRDGDE
jgi:hypothetical protein